MVIGAFLIVLVEFVFNVMVVSRGSASLPLHSLTSYMDTIFSWLVVNIGGIFWSDRSITEIFPRGDVLMSLADLKLALIVIVIVGASLGPLPLAIALDATGSYDIALRGLIILPILLAFVALFLRTPEKLSQLTKSAGETES